MHDSERADARVSDLVVALLPVLLLTSAALIVFLMRQVYGPSRAVRIAWWSMVLLPVIGAAFSAWSPWRSALDGIGLMTSGGIAVRLLRSAIAFTAVALPAWGAPWLVVRHVVDLASPFESMKWILTTGIILHGLVFRAVLSRRRVPLWMGVVYWLSCAAIGLVLWNRVAGLFA